MKKRNATKSTSKPRYRGKVLPMRFVMDQDPCEGGLHAALNQLKKADLLVISKKAKKAIDDWLSKDDFDLEEIDMGLVEHNVSVKLTDKLVSIMKSDPNVRDYAFRVLCDYPAAVDAFEKAMLKKHPRLFKETIKEATWGITTDAHVSVDDIQDQITAHQQELLRLRAELKEATARLASGAGIKLSDALYDGDVSHIAVRLLGSRSSTDIGQDLLASLRSLPLS